MRDGCGKAAITPAMTTKPTRLPNVTSPVCVSSHAARSALTKSVRNWTARHLPKLICSSRFVDEQTRRLGFHLLHHPLHRFRLLLVRRVVGRPASGEHVHSSLVADRRLKRRRNDVRLRQILNPGFAERGKHVCATNSHRNMASAPSRAARTIFIIPVLSNRAAFRQRWNLALPLTAVAACY